MMWLAVAFWYAAIVWVAADAARRRRSWFGWALLVTMTNVVGLGIWLVVRRRVAVVDGRLTPLRWVLLGLAPVPALIVGAVFVMQLGSMLSLIQVARIEGQAMAPTLNNQDRLIVNKGAYVAYRPARGDIVMHRYPPDPRKMFVKRVIAIGGDTVRSVEGRVFVNDVPLSDDYIPRQYRSHDTWGPHTVPAAQVFVLGDHRNNSSDSRHWGLVPEDLVLGKVALRWWPIQDAGTF
jgi:signal peptidase I